MDFPRAWQISRATHESFHHIDCSYRKTHGGLLCDCHILTKHPEYETKENKGGNMGKCWIIEETPDWKKGRLVDLDLQNTESGQVLAIVTEYPSNPLEELKEQIELLVCFIPEGWEMPLGWNQVVSQAKEAIQKAMTIVEGKERE